MVVVVVVGANNVDNGSHPENDVGDDGIDIDVGGRDEDRDGDGAEYDDNTIMNLQVECDTDVHSGGAETCQLS